MDLLARAQAGDRDALERLCERYRPLLRHWARGRLPLWARGLVDTDDVVQDTMVHTVHRLGSFEPRHGDALLAYLRQAVQNRIRDEIRKRQRSPDRDSLDDATPDAAPSPLDATVRAEHLERYEAALARISPEDRELVVLRIELGLSYEQLASAVGRPSPNAARMAVMRALLRLGEAIRRES
jgi:RNA polymerase sigma-70 factor (ECF subfamily)